MKVLQPGRNQRSWAVETICTGVGNGGGGCGAKLLVEKTDLFQTSRHPYGDDAPTYYATFKCPCCQVLTDLNNPPFNAKDLPVQAKTAQVDPQ